MGLVFLSVCGSPFISYFIYPFVLLYCCTLQEDQAIITSVMKASAARNETSLMLEEVRNHPIFTTRSCVTPQSSPLHLGNLPKTPHRTPPILRTKPRVNPDQTPINKPRL